MCLHLKDKLYSRSNYKTLRGACGVEPVKHNQPPISIPERAAVPGMARLPAPDTDPFSEGRQDAGAREVSSRTHADVSASTRAQPRPPLHARGTITQTSSCSVGLPGFQSYWYVHDKVYNLPGLSFARSRKQRRHPASVPHRAPHFQHEHLLSRHPKLLSLRHSNDQTRPEVTKGSSCCLPSSAWPTYNLLFPCFMVVCREKSPSSLTDLKIFSMRSALKVFWRTKCLLQNRRGDGESHAS